MDREAKQGIFKLYQSKNEMFKVDFTVMQKGMYIKLLIEQSDVEDLTDLLRMWNSTIGTPEHLKH